MDAQRETSEPTLELRRLKRAGQPEVIQQAHKVLMWSPGVASESAVCIGIRFEWRDLPLFVEE